MKKKLQRFFTLTRQEAGFTLVELIVVIAILAILAGIGVPAYSGYITKTNMAADETLAGEVRHALELAYYSNFSDPITGYVILSNTTAPDYGNDEDVKAALEAVFGENLDALTLKYDGWDPSFLTTALSSVNPGAVGESSYIKNSAVSDLLDNVQVVTSAASEVLGGKARDEGHLINLLKTTLGPDYLAKAAAAGVINTDGSGNYTLKEGTYETAEGGGVQLSADLQNQLSNMMVFSVAEELQNTSTENMMNLMLVGVVDGAAIPEGYSEASALAARYALFKAYALDNGKEDDFNELNDKLLAAGSQNGALTIVDNAFKDFVAENQEGLGTYLQNIDTETGDVTFTDAFYNNADAVSSIMNGVTSVEDKYANADALASGTLYTSGAVANDLNAYISASAAAANLSNLTVEEKAALTTALSGVSSGIVVTVGQNGAVVLKAGN